MLTTDHFILSCFQHGYKVRMSTLYHVLVGKRTSSVLMYAFFYDHLAYFGLLPSLERDSYEEALARLITKGFLIQDEETVQLTLNGHRQLLELSPLPTSNIASHLYLKIDDEFLDLLLFATQVISCLAHVEKHYTPIEVRVDKQRFIRKWLQAQTLNRVDLAARFYHEWLFLLTKLKPSEAKYWIDRLSGYQKTGKTSYQLLADQSGDVFYVFLHKKNNDHQLLALIERFISHVPLMKSLRQGIKHHPFNQSMLESVEIIKENGTLEAVQSIRRLKQSTVVDHLIEWAIYDENYRRWFDINSEMTTALKAYAKQHPLIRDWRFKDVQAALPTLRFYEMRLFQINEIREGKGR